MGRDSLSAGDIEALLSGTVVPDDAPPGYGRVAALLKAAKRRGRGPAEIDPAIQKRLAEAVTSATQREVAGAGPPRRIRGKKAAAGVLVLVAATSSLAAAGVIPKGPFAGLPYILDRGVDDGPKRSPYGGRAHRPSSREVAPSAVTEAPVPPVPPPAPNNGSSAPAPPPATVHTTPPPEPTTVTRAQHMPPGQARNARNAARGRDRRPAHAQSNSGHANGNNGNGRGGNGGRQPKGPPSASAQEAPGQRPTSGPEGQPGAPAGRGPTSRGG